MSNQLSIRNKNPLPGDDKTGKMIAVTGFTVAVLGFIYWLSMGEAKAAPAATPDPVPEPGPEPGPLELYVSDDCKVVKAGSNWAAGWLLPRIIEKVYQGNGGPILSNDVDVLNASMNAVVRDMIAPWTDCAVKVPWPDWYVADSPVPTPQPGQTRQQFYQLMGNHRTAFVTQLAGSIKVYPQLNTLIGEVGKVVEEVFLDRYGYDQQALANGGDDLGGSQGKLSVVQKNRLRAMGYAITDEVIELFQSDFNRVMETWVGVDWYTDMSIEPTNQMDNSTDDAIEFAWRSAHRGVAWAGMVSQATGFGANDEPPKEAPNA